MIGGQGLEGTVVAFDEGRGCGEVEVATGERFPFHSTQLADGTRRIAVGSAVVFTVRPGLLGTWEASDIQHG